ncbi:hypothetical protein [Hymenobacter jeollabukensis]|uniref:Uncharacterized protein n=1 Tax=Hymenobacter jeollabukensis TaxID=2025313 RepID=A0A5R8WUJ8_9BACT|nr:hypothetical protein [Hymenobacter jeollabukensis]TLM95163.1 hypothetical protein FDY95_05050 [Hymenobacter jeollabukensis]
MNNLYSASAMLTVGSLVFDRSHLCAPSSVLTLTPNSVELRLHRHYPEDDATRRWFTRAAFDARFSLLPA